MKAPKHIARVKQLPCVACRGPATDAHHIRMTPITGAGQKASDWLTMPLCRTDHADLHADIPMWEMRYGRQIDHVVATLNRLYR
mgnify:CR=1 FL=1